MNLGVFPQWSEITTYNILSSMGFKWISDHQIDCAAIIEQDEIKNGKKFSYQNWLDSEKKVFYIEFFISKLESQIIFVYFIYSSGSVTQL